MAKIFRISGYYVDLNDYYNKDSLQIALEESFDLMDKHIKVEEVDIGEWEDDNPLNYINSNIVECEKYFKN